MAVSHIVVEGALYLVPALLLAGALLLGRRPCERLLVALHRRRAFRSGKLRSAKPGLRLAHPTESFFPRGGRLIAAALAGRAPPAWATSHRF